jgi:hypothetical protein
MRLARAPDPGSGRRMSPTSCTVLTRTSFQSMNALRSRA